MPPEEKPPQPRPKPPKPKPNASPKPKKPPRPLPQLEATTSSGGGGGVPYLPPDPFACANNCSDSCAFYHLCPPPPPSNPAARVHISSGRLPTPLIALSASLLAVSAVLLLALLLHRLARRRRRRRNTAALAVLQDVEGGQQVLPGGGEEVEVEEDGDEGGVHHVWYIRTKGLDERAIAAIAAVVYDAGDKKKSGSGKDDDGSCAVCLGEFRHGETLRLLPRCGHAFHRGCIDTWLRAHVNCPLCRAPVQVAAAAADLDTAAGAAPAPERNINPRAGSGGGRGGGVRAEEAERGGVPAERGVRRAASMVALPRRGGAAWWPDASYGAPASSSGREVDMAAGLGKIMRLLKFSDSMEEMAGVGAGAGRSVSFSAAGSCQRLPATSGPSAAGGVSSDEMPQ
ncbi:unnamed protein product [Urochloa humidicola]